MTRQRNDKHSTPFGLWIREQNEIDSSLGFVTTDIDYLWENYKTGDWMMVEEKRFMSECPFSQKAQLKSLNHRIIHDPKFKGIHLLQFERTSPDDGRIYWDRKEITRDQLIQLLRFET